MKDTLKISVCIPYYNSSEYLEDALNSIWMQTYKNYEVVVYNDGSSQKNTSLLNKALQKFDGKYEIINNDKNQGTLYARAKMFNHINGDIVMSLDSDDKFVDRDAFKKIVKIFTNSNCDMVIFGFTKNLDDVYPMRYIEKNLIEYKGNTTFKLKQLFCHKSTIDSICFKALKASLVRDIKTNICDINYHEDTYLTSLIMGKCRNIEYINDVFYYYRPNSNSLTNRKFNSELLKDAVITDIETYNITSHWGVNNLKFEDRLCYITLFDILPYGLSVYGLRQLVQFYRMITKNETINKCLNEVLQKNYKSFYKSLARKIALWLLKNRMYFLLAIYLELYYLAVFKNQ